MVSPGPNKLILSARICTLSAELLFLYFSGPKCSRIYDKSICENITQNVLRSDLLKHGHYKGRVLYEEVPDGQRLLFLHSISDCNGFLCQENPFFSFRF